MMVLNGGHVNRGNSGTGKPATKREMYFPHKQVLVTENLHRNI